LPCLVATIGLAAPATVIHEPRAPANVRLAAREVQRYVYLRTDERLPIAEKRPGAGSAIALGVDQALEAQQYRLQTVSGDLHITGGSDVAVLYGVYHFAETLGVRFYLHGDVVPDKKIPFALPTLDETHKPLFDQRGIQPFHDFPEGPDWWEMDDYKTHLSQLVKMRMNWIGFHCYPESGPGPEPLVWIGLPEDVNADGTVKFAYPSRWFTTQGGTFGYNAAKTGDFSAGANLLFTDDYHGPSVTDGHRPPFIQTASHMRRPLPQDMEGATEVYDKTGRFLNEVFTRARDLGITTVIGTETPLVLPAKVKERLESKGMNPADPAVVQKVYEGMFTRIARTHPLDYFWVWTPEPWTHRGNTPEQLTATVTDLDAALKALEAVGYPFKFGTCGWVLGPQQDRSLFDRRLPQDAAMACINSKFGFKPVEPGFAKVKDRPKWAIPWLEDDPGMIIPQLWAGRVRRDAADALAYGCTGLMGIHWRTKTLSPTVSALARAGWDQTGWDTAPAAKPTSRRDMPAGDFYSDWCRAWFGEEVAIPMANMFTALDSGGGKGRELRAHLPRPGLWTQGGSIAINPNAWARVSTQYAFVDSMEKLRDQVKGAGNLERFDYWLNSMRYLRAMGRIGCLRGALDKAMKRVNSQKNQASRMQAAKQALTLRINLARQWEKLMTLQLAVTDTIGGIGTIANLEQHVLRNFRDGGKNRFMDIHDGALARALGRDLPAEVHPTKRYLGAPRLIVPTVRPSVDEGEALTLKVIVLDNERPKTAALYWRPMGDGPYRKLDLKHVARGVYTVTLPPADGSMEYYIVAVAAGGETLNWPATAPGISQTVVTAPRRDGR
jgi:hypothetical protein